MRGVGSPTPACVVGEGRGVPSQLPSDVKGDEGKSQPQDV